MRTALVPETPHRNPSKSFPFHHLLTRGRLSSVTITSVVFSISNLQGSAGVIGLAASRAGVTLPFTLSGNGISLLVIGLTDLEGTGGVIVALDSTIVELFATEISSLLPLTRSFPASNQFFVAPRPPWVGLVNARGIGFGLGGGASISIPLSSRDVFLLFDFVHPPTSGISLVLARKPSPSICTPLSSVFASRLQTRIKLFRFDPVPLPVQLGVTPDRSHMPLAAFPGVAAPPW